MNTTPISFDALELQLESFVRAARNAFREHLESVVLFGSAAEGRLRCTSDVNVALILTHFEPERARALAPAAAMARAAIRLAPLFLLRDEFASASDHFAPKFADIARRHRVLHGPDPFAALVIRREAQTRELAKLVLNLSLRLRARIVRASVQEERSAVTLAEEASPARVAAATLLALEGRPASSPRDELKVLTIEILPDRGTDLLACISQARASGTLPAGVGASALDSLLQLVQEFGRRVERLD